MPSLMLATHIAVAIATSVTSALFVDCHPHCCCHCQNPLHMFWKPRVEKFPLPSFFFSVAQRSVIYPPPPAPVAVEPSHTSTSSYDSRGLWARNISSSRRLLNIQPGAKGNWGPIEAATIVGIRTEACPIVRIGKSKNVCSGRGSGSTATATSTQRKGLMSQQWCESSESTICINIENWLFHRDGYFFSQVPAPWISTSKHF